MVPAVLLLIDAEIAHRQAAVRADWAASSRHPCTEQERSPALRGLRRRAGRLLHA